METKDAKSTIGTTEADFIKVEIAIPDTLLLIS
jgi:hypothetical protein